MKKKKDIKRIMFQVVIPLIAGALFGIVSAFSISEFVGENPMTLGVFIISMAILYFLQIILHETGHMIAGWMTGYKLASFRVGSYLLKKESGKWCLRRYSIPGTGGQCLMTPPENGYGTFPFIWYNLGGVAVNILLGIISLIAILIFPNMGQVPKAIHIANVLVSLVIVIQNGIPMKIGGVPNDAYNVKAMCKDKNVQKIFYLQLYTYGVILDGMKWSEISPELFSGIEIAPENPFYASYKLMDYNRYLDAHEFATCYEILNKLLQSKEYMPKIFQLQVNAERLYLELIGESRSEVIEEIVTAEFRDFLKRAKFLVNCQRALYAYEILYKKDEKSVKSLYPHLKKMIDQNPILGEVELERGLFEIIQEKAGIIEEV